MKLIPPTEKEIRYVCVHAGAADVVEHSAFQWDGQYNSSALTEQLVRNVGPAHVFRGGDGVPYAISGCSIVLPGVYRSWMVRTGEWSRHLLEVTRICRFVSTALLESKVARRVECRTPLTETAHKWNTMLGLNLEGVMRYAGANGEDIALFAKTR